MRGYVVQLVAAASGALVSDRPGPCFLRGGSLAPSLAPTSFIPVRVNVAFKPRRFIVGNFGEKRSKTVSSTRGNLKYLHSWPVFEKNRVLSATTKPLS